MSHFAQLKVNAQVKNEKDLVDALNHYFGEESCSVHDPAIKLTGYDAGAGVKGHLVVKKDAVGRKNARRSAYNDVGFERKTDGTYDLHYDPMDLSQDQKNVIMQDYVARVSARKLKAQGFQVRQVVLPTGEVQVIGQKYT